jgi:FAD:protein FMN transferase
MPATMVRSQPWLGTFVSIAVHANQPRAEQCIQAAFKAVAHVHEAMSFQNPRSELSDLNRLAHQRPVQVSAATYRILQASMALAKYSNGCFDPTVAGRLVRDGVLSPPNANPINESANWQDVQLLGNQQVQFRTPLWLDLSGIAKGYAVDLAIRTLKKNGVKAGTVNAGGDIRLFGHQQTVFVRNPYDLSEQIPLLQLENGAVATSANYFTDIDENPCALFDAESQHYLQQPCSITVTAPRAIWADALTKIVLAKREHCLPLLKRLNASAMLIGLDGSRLQIN